MTRSLAVTLAFVFALAHVMFLPAALEDIDSVNFALGVRDFDVAEHRPHPPGYPVYIGIGKAAVALTAQVFRGHPRSAVEARALAWLSLLAGTISVLLLYRLFACLGTPDEAPEGRPWTRLQPAALAASALAVSCPLFWYMAARPMSDLPGFAFALASQVCLALAWWRQTPVAASDRRLGGGVLAASGRMIVLGALLAGLAAGVRSQTGWLTAPLLALVLLDRIGRGVGPALLGSTVAFAVGAAVWIVPLLAASGGLNPYLAALGSQAGEDFAGGEMVYLNPAPRVIAIALLRTFVYPWDSLVLGIIVLTLALVGAVGLMLRDRRTLAALVALSAPYALFHLLFQDTSFVRYALPLVPALAFLATAGIALAAPRAVLPSVGVLTVWALTVASPALARYAVRPSPTSRAVEAMWAEAPSGQPGALAMHQTFRRPLEAEELPAVERLPSPPRREWLELVRYWQAGHTAPLWFLADPRRTDLALVDPASRRDRVAFRWDVDSLSSLGGMRPTDVWWYRMPPPGWFAEEGWALTPETAGIARLMGRAPHLGPIKARVRRRADDARMMVGGRHLGADTDPDARFTVSLDDRPIATWDTAPGFFLRVFDVPAQAFAGTGPLARLNVVSSAISSGTVLPTSVEQFDVQPLGTLMWGFNAGWHEAEYNPALGIWHWTEERAALSVIGATLPVQLSLRIESPLRYFDRPSEVKIMAGARTLHALTVSETRDLVLVIPPEALAESDGTVTIETDQTFVPAERNDVSDRRRLGLRIFDVEIRQQEPSLH